MSRAPHHDGFRPADGRAGAGGVCDVVSGVSVEAAETVRGDEGKGEEGVPEMFG
ncbi:hypothetical protein [Streptomyces sp. YIM B13518]|uniref:hypothetical protein n=1 Tax=Streptomyces sp. YIM B13518 TaxID=3366316 RepID=UPI00368427E4